MTALEVTCESRYEGTGGLHGSARCGPREFLTAGNLAALLRAAGLPCVTLTTEAAAAAEPASTAEEGLRIVAGSSPVRVFYAAPPGDAADRRRGSHLMWLAGFTEDHRWSAEWLASGWMIVHSEPKPATYLHNGHEVFRATGRRTDENLGSHVVFWIVEDAGAWADAIFAEVFAEVRRAPKNRRFTTYMQQQRLESAGRILVAGPNRTVYSTEHGKDRADQHAAGLAADQPNPGRPV